jgi:thiamine pyrophosphate-dependent acetolactate synthase large subunit-like protein
MPDLDFVVLAIGQGLYGCKGDQAEALKGVLQLALAAERPTLVEVRVG